MASWNMTIRVRPSVPCKLSTAGGSTSRYGTLLPPSEKKEEKRGWGRGEKGERKEGRGKREERGGKREEKREEKEGSEKRKDRGEKREERREKRDERREKGGG